MVTYNIHKSRGLDGRVRPDRILRVLSEINPDVIALRRRVNAGSDAAIGRTEARVAILLRNGQRLLRHVPHALGTLQRPMSNADLEAKFRSLTAGILSERQASTLIACCRNVEDLEDAAGIARLSVPAREVDITTGAASPHAGQ